jgi:hypothetical protein
MVKLPLFSEIFLFLCFNFSSAFCDVGSYNSHSDSSSHKGAQSNYMIIRYVIGSGGILGSTSASKIHSATAGETFVGFMQGNNNLLLSGFWQQGFIFDDVDEKAEVNPPKTFALYQNYPNPFNPQTAIQYDLPGEFRVSIEIFNVAGQGVRLLMDNEIQGPGAMEIIWNGLDDAGDILSSGVYLCRIYCRSTESKKNNSRKEFQDTIKMLLVR